MLTRSAAALGTGCLALLAACSGATATSPAPPSSQPPPATPTPQLARIQVAVTANSVEIGHSITLVASGFDQLERAIAIAAPTWSSSAPQTATVSAAGIVTGVTAGTARITVQSGVVSAFVVVTVVAPNVSVVRVVVQPPQAALTVGGQLQMQATLLDAGGTAITGVSPAWSVSPAGIATVTQAGLVTANAPGTAIVVASYDGAIGGASLVVSGAPDSAIRVTVAAPASGQVVADTLEVVATVRMSAAPVRVVAVVAGVQVGLRKEQAGAMGGGEAWVGRLDLLALQFGRYWVVVTAYGPGSTFGVDSVQFDRNPLEGTSGNPPSGGKKLLKPVVPVPFGPIEKPPVTRPMRPRRPTPPESPHMPTPATASPIGAATYRPLPAWAQRHRGRSSSLDRRGVIVG